MTNLHQVAHVGVLVNHLDEAIERWSAALGAPVSPKFLYRAGGWSDADNATPHSVDLRQAISYCTGPWIQLFEPAPTTVHGSQHGQGGHHLGFTAVTDGKARGRELARLGFAPTAGSEKGGDQLIQFTEPGDLGGVFTEWVQVSPLHLNLKDDGTPLDRLADGSESPFGSAIADVAERRPSGLDEIGIVVESLEASIPDWASITGDDFVVAPDGASAASAVSSPRIRLVARSGGAVPGLSYIAYRCADMAAKRAELAASNVPTRTAEASVIEIEPDFLNGFAVIFRGM